MPPAVLYPKPWSSPYSSGGSQGKGQSRDLRMFTHSPGSPSRLCFLVPSPPPLCSGGSRADSCRPGSPFRLGLVWSMGGGTRGRSEGEGNSQGIPSPCVPSTLPLPQDGPSGSGSCLGGPGLCTPLIPPPSFGPAARVKVLPAGANCLTTPWLASLLLPCLSPFPAFISSGMNVASVFLGGL